jgi:hypothetical protein
MLSKKIVKVILKVALRVDRTRAVCGGSGRTYMVATHRARLSPPPAAALARARSLAASSKGSS